MTKWETVFTVVALLASAAMFYAAWHDNFKKGK